MGKKTSIFLTCLIVIVLAFLSVVTFVSHGYKNSNLIYNSIVGSIELGADLKGSVSYELELKNDLSSEDEEIDVRGVLNTMKDRLVFLGYEDMRLKAYRASGNSDYRIVIEIEERSSNAEDIESVIAYGDVNLTDNNGTVIISGAKAIKSGETLSQASGGNMQYGFSITLTNEGRKAINAYFDENGSFTLTAEIEGSDVNPFTTTISERLTDNTVAWLVGSTDSAKAAASRYVLMITTGGIEQEYAISEDFGVGLTGEAFLGARSAKAALWAVIATTLVIMILFIALYRGLGLIAAVSVYLTALLNVLILVTINGVTVNFGGVIGIAFTVVLSAISNLVIIEAIKKEYAKGKTIKYAVTSVYNRFILPITDVSAILGAFQIIGILAAKTVLKSFAITFGIGLLISFVTSLFFSRLLTNALIAIVSKKEGFFNLKREETK